MFIHLNCHTCHCVYGFELRSQQMVRSGAHCVSVAKMEPKQLIQQSRACVCVSAAVCLRVGRGAVFGVRLPFFYPQFSLVLRSHLGRSHKEDVFGFAEDVVAHRQPNHRTTTIVAYTTAERRSGRGERRKKVERNHYHTACSYTL